MNESKISIHKLQFIFHTHEISSKIISKLFVNCLLPIFDLNSRNVSRLFFRLLFVIWRSHQVLSLFISICCRTPEKLIPYRTNLEQDLNLVSFNIVPVNSFSCCMAKFQFQSNGICSLTIMATMSYVIEESETEGERDRESEKNIVNCISCNIRWSELNCKRRCAQCRANKLKKKIMSENNLFRCEWVVFLLGGSILERWMVSIIIIVLSSYPISRLRHWPCSFCSFFFTSVR